MITWEAIIYILTKNKKTSGEYLLGSTIFVA